MDRGTDSDHLIGVDALGRGLTEELLHDLLDSRDTGGTAHEDHLVDIGGGVAGIGQSLLARLDGGTDQVVAQLLELGTREGAHKVLRHPVDRHDVGQVDLRGVGAGELDLGLLSSLFQTLQSHSILTQVHVIVLHKLLSQPVDDLMVEVVAAQVRVTIGGLHFKHAVTQFQDGDIEGTATEVEHGHFGVCFLLVKAVCQSGSRRFVDNTFHVQTGDLTSLLGGLTL